MSENIPNPRLSPKVDDAQSVKSGKIEEEFEPYATVNSAAGMSSREPKAEKMDAILGAINIFAIPLVFLNLLGGIISGIWLAYLGQWWALGYGFAALLVSTFSLSFALLPGILLAAPGAYFFEKGYKLPMYFFGFLSGLYTIALISAWCILVLWLYVQRAEHNTLLPLLIWSFGTATGPWGYMANKENQGGESYASTILAIFSQIGYVVMAVMVFFFRVSFLDITIAFCLVMLIALFIQVALAIAIARESEDTFF
jgi:hypothetical protein